MIGVPRWLVVGLLIVVTALTLVRVDRFVALEPRGDQTFEIDWVQSLRRADHLLPERLPGQGWLDALQTDETSVAYALLRPLYTGNTTLFLLGAVAWSWLGSLVFGTSAAALVTASILAQSAAVFLLGLAGFLLIPPAAGLAVRVGIGALAVLFAATSALLHVFAPMGYHNAGLLGLVGATLVTGRWLAGIGDADRPTRGDRRWVLPVLAQIAACYTSYGNILLLPPATLLALLAMPAGRDRRWRRAGGYLAALAVAFLPAGLLLAATAGVPHDVAALDSRWLYGEDHEIGRLTGDQQTFATILRFLFAHGGIDYLLGAPGAWLRLQAELFSPAGLAGALAGLVILAWRWRQPLPLALIAVHFLVSVALPQFGQQPDRTLLYAVPILALGLAALVVAALSMAAPGWPAGRSGRIAGVAGVLAAVLAAASYLSVQLPALADPRQSSLWGRYYQEEGYFWPIAAELPDRVPPGAVLVAWDQLINLRVRTLARPDRHGIRPFRTLDILYAQARSGQLAAYAARRRLTLRPDQRLYLLAPTGTAVDQLRQITATVFCSPVFGYCRTIDLEPLGSWPLWPSLTVNYGDRLVLYRVVAGVSP